jgi:putative ABC transport system permease protein
MSPWALAWRTVARNPARAVLAVAGVAVIGALLFDMLLLSRGLMLSFSDLLESSGVEIRVMARSGSMIHRGLIPDATELARSIEALPSVRRATLLRSGAAEAFVPGQSERISVEFIGLSGGEANPGWRLVRGANLPRDTSPNEPPPLIVSPGLAAALHLEPGSAVSLRTSVSGAASALPPITCRVAGIGEFMFGAADDRAAATTLNGFAAVHGRPADNSAEIVLVTSQPGAGAAVAARDIARLRPDLRVYSNEQVLEQFNDNAFSYFRQISTVLSTLTLAFAFLLVATLLTMSVNQRLGEVAGARGVGVFWRRIASNLLWESAMLVGCGGLLALPLGGAIAYGLDGILRDMPNMPAQLHFFVLEPRTVALHIGLLAITGLLAAAYPIWIATRLPIAPTLRREIVS